MNKGLHRGPDAFVPSFIQLYLCVVTGLQNVALPPNPRLPRPTCAPEEGKPSRNIFCKTTNSLYSRLLDFDKDYPQE